MHGVDHANEVDVEGIGEGVTDFKPGDPLPTMKELAERSKDRAVRLVHDAEGWRYVLLSDPRTPPQASPPNNVEDTPIPKPTKKPSAKPTNEAAAT